MNKPTDEQQSKSLFARIGTFLHLNMFLAILMTAALLVAFDGEAIPPATSRAVWAYGAASFVMMAGWHFLKDLKGKKK